MKPSAKCIDSNQSKLQTLLFTGKSIVYDPDNAAIDVAAMFGFIQNRHGNVAVANRIFETRLYNRYLSTVEIQNQQERIKLYEFTAIKRRTYDTAADRCLPETAPYNRDSDQAGPGVFDKATVFAINWA